MTEPRNGRVPDELEPEAEYGREEADQSDGLEMDSSWESMLDKRFADMADEQVVGLAQQGDSVAVEYLLSKYKNFVRSKARSYFLIGADHDDLRSGAKTKSDRKGTYIIQAAHCRSSQLNFTDPAQKRSVRHINDILCQKTQKDWITNIPNLLV